MSKNEVKTDRLGDQQILSNALKSRYGAKIASEIMEKVNHAISSQETPDYMPVKACSEMLELFRSEAQDILKKLKNGSEEWVDEDSNVSFLEKRKLELEFGRTYRLYRISMKLFYPLYKRAIADYQDKISSYGRPSDTPTKAIAAL